MWTGGSCYFPFCCPSTSSDAYDVMTASGAFAPGHLYSNAIPTLLRVLKSGSSINVYHLIADYAA
jgi:hypothetical protein